MWTVECWRADRATKEMGAIDVKVYTVNGDTDEEKLVRTYHLDVRRVERVRGSTTNPEPDAPQYYIARHAEAPASLSPSDVGLDLPHGYARCSVNGKRLSLPGPQPFADQAISLVKRSYRVIHTDRLAAGGAFYGQPWTSPEEKAMAARVPRKGRPHPLPSTQAK